MASNKRVGNKLPVWADRTASNNFVDTATYIGIVKDNLDPARAGRLRVWIPDLGGDENNDRHWKTVNYASPYFGVTHSKSVSQSKDNKWDQNNHTYGMWMIPPDLENEVLCTFVNGDPDRGYWFACVGTGVAGRHMTPGMASANGNLDTNFLNSALKPSVKDTSNPPVTETNENIEGALGPTFFYNNKPIHEPQYRILLKQGLDKDNKRGAITSSSQRETPSAVFGISTPGRFFDDTANDTEFLKKLEEQSLTADDLPTGARVGGHQLVMDDGDLYGNDNLVRLRTAGGHQLLLNDTEKIVYLANSSGSVWLEFGDNGQVYFYSAGGLNIRTEGDLNLHSDKNININAKQNINIKAAGNFALNTNETTFRSIGKTTMFGGGINLGSSSDFALYASGKGSVYSNGTLTCRGDKILLNSGGGVKVSDPGTIPILNHADSSRADDNSAWESVASSLDSIATVVPSHEPWTRASGSLQGAGQGYNASQRTDLTEAPSKFIGPVNCRGTPQEELDPGPAEAQSRPVDNPMPKDWVLRPDAPNPPGGIGPLSQWQVKCVMAQMAYSESRFDYQIKERNRGNYLGRYQIGAAVLTQYDYIYDEYFSQYKTLAVRYPDAWTGIDNIRNQDDFLANEAAQEKLMYTLMSSNYRTLLGNKGIKDGDDLCTVAGMLCVAQLLGATGAKNWRYSAQGKDANGSSGTIYYNRGRYAIDIVANSGPGTTSDPGALTATTRTTGGLTPAAVAAAQANINPLDVLQFTPAASGNTGTGTYEKFQQCDDAFKAMILGAAKEYRDKYKEKLIVYSSLRTQEDQTKLYNAWRDAGGRYSQEGGPTSVRTQYGTLFIPLKKAGNHSRGTALDANNNQLSRMQSMGLFEKYGLQWLGPSADPPHVQVPRRRG